MSPSTQADNRIPAGLTSGGDGGLSVNTGVAEAVRAPRRDVVRNRALLLAAADKLLAEHGINLSLNAVAREAGVGIGTVYRHFTGRDEILAALLKQRVASVAAVFERCTHFQDPVQGLRTAVLEVCAMQVTDRGLWELLAAGYNEAHRQSLDETVVPLADLLVERAIATGRVRADLSPSDLPAMLWVGGALNSYAAHVAPTLWRRYVELMLDGFTLSPGDAPRPPLPVLALTHEQTALIRWPTRAST